MTTETEEQGVTQEDVADSHESESNEQDSQQINWQKANETMAEQKRRLEQLEKQNQTYQQQIEMVQRHMGQQNQASSAQGNEDVGIPDDEILTGADFKKAISSYEKQFQQRLDQQNSQLTYMQMKAQYPDYDEVVKETVNMATQDPALAEALRTSSNPGLLAYRLGKSAQPHNKQKEEETKKIIENSRKPGLGSNTSGNSGVLSKADFFLNMSDKDFEQHIAKVKRGLF